MSAVIGVGSIELVLQFRLIVIPTGVKLGTVLTGVCVCVCVHMCACTYV